MADRSSAHLFGCIFDLIDEHVKEPKKRKALAARFWKMSRDYDFSEYLWQGMREAYRRMAELQFAAGARRVRQVHLDARWAGNAGDALRHVETLRMVKFRTGLFSAHLMGGCGMSDDPRRGVVDSHGRHHQLENLSVFDGSVFPTSVGANPQLSVFALAAQNADALARSIAA